MKRLTLLLLPLLLACFSSGCGGGSSATSPSATSPTSAAIQISSLSQTTISPLTQLTINGTGFDPASAAISVLLTPACSGCPPISVPAFAATTSTLQIVVPPFFDTSTGIFTAGAFNVQVIQLDGNALSTSNVITGLQVNAPPTIPTGIPTGAVTSTFLSNALGVSASIQTDALTDASLDSLSMNLQTYDADLNALLAAVNTVSTNPAQSVALPTVNGQTVTLNTSVLALSDQLIWIWAQQILSEESGSVAKSQRRAQQSTATWFGRSFWRRSRRNQNDGLSNQKQDQPPNPDCALDPAIQQACDAEQKFQAAGQFGAQESLNLFNALFGTILTTVSGGIADEEVAAGAIGAKTGLAFEMAFSGFVAYVSSDLTATQLVPNAVPCAMMQTLIDKEAEDKFGVPSVVTDAIPLCEVISALASSSTGSPQGGLIVTASQSGAPSGTTAVNGFQTVNGNSTENTYAAPNTQGSESTNAATISPSPQSGTYVGSCNGQGSAYSCCDSSGNCSTFPPTPGSEPFSYKLSEGINFSSSGICSAIASAAAGAGCTAPACACTAGNNSISCFGSCTIPAANGCTSIVVTGSCGASLQP